MRNFVIKQIISKRLVKIKSGHRYASHSSNNFLLWLGRQRQSSNFLKKYQNIQTVRKKNIPFQIHVWETRQKNDFSVWKHLFIPK